MEQAEEKLIKSKQRVKAHGEVFTPSWMVEKMLDVVKEDTKNIHATFLEPAAGNGNFLVAILKRKLGAVKQQFPKEQWKEKSLFALASIYGIEMQMDNLKEARQLMLEVFLNFHHEIGENISERTDIYKSAQLIIRENICWGDTLKKKQPDGEAIILNEWLPIDADKNTVHRMPFKFASLFGENPQEDLVTRQQLSLFSFEEEAVKPSLEVFKPISYKIVPITKVYKEETL
ncbi:MAG: hypothetical protein FWF59_03350 [Turicibacter sp.]|nr:hypothetical protein [Turicibacter sp.]